MGWIDRLHGHIVGLDTAPLIYFIEQHPKYTRVVQPFFEALSKGELTAVASTVTLLEVLVHPLRQGNATLAQQYRSILLNAANLTIVNVSPDIAEEAAQIRALHNTRTPDAIQLSTAINRGATFFLTNDKHIPVTSAIEVLVVDDL